MSCFNCKNRCAIPWFLYPALAVGLISLFVWGFSWLDHYADHWEELIYVECVENELIKDGQAIHQIVFIKGITEDGERVQFRENIQGYCGSMSDGDWYVLRLSNDIGIGPPVVKSFRSVADKRYEEGVPPTVIETEAIQIEAIQIELAKTE